MKKALVLAGGVPQAELIRNLQKRGYTVLLADYLNHPPAKTVADRFFQISTLDVDAIEDLARREGVDFVVTCCTDQALMTVAEVSERLGLPCYMDADTARNVTNKRYMKSVFAAHGIPTAKFLVTTDTDPAHLSGFAYPLVVKPVDCNSSKGVVKVYTPGEYPAAMENAIRLSRTHDAIVEEYKTGKEISCDFMVEDGVVTTLAVTESQKIRSDDKFVICRAVYPPEISDVARRKIGDIAQKIVDAFKLRNCPLLVQTIVNGDEVDVIEFSARTGGAIKYRLVYNLSSVDVVNAVAELTVNGKFHAEPVYRDQCLINEFLYCEPGVLDRVEGLEELLASRTVDEAYVFKAKGDRMTGVNSSGDRVCALTFLGKDMKDLEARRRKAIQSLRVFDTEGNDILNRSIYPEDF